MKKDEPYLYYYLLIPPKTDPTQRWKIMLETCGNLLKSFPTHFLARTESDFRMKANIPFYDFYEVEIVKFVLIMKIATSIPIDPS